MNSVIIDVAKMNLRDVADEDRPSLCFGTLDIEGRDVEIRFKGVTGCLELGMGSNPVDLDEISAIMDKIPKRQLKKSIQKIIRYLCGFIGTFC